MKRAPVLALLRRLEWRGPDYSCPDCKALHREGHAPLCELDAMLTSPAGVMSVAFVPALMCSCCKGAAGRIGKIPFGDKHAAEILDQVCDETGVRRELILGRSRVRPVVDAREAVARRLRDLCDDAGRPIYSYPAIGKFLRRDHTTILSLLSRRPGLPRRISAQDVRDIRDRRAKGHSQRAIARTYGINRGAVRDIERYKTWGAVT